MGGLTSDKIVLHFFAATHFFDCTQWLTAFEPFVNYHFRKAVLMNCMFSEHNDRWIKNKVFIIFGSYVPNFMCGVLKKVVVSDMNGLNGLNKRKSKKVKPVSGEMPDRQNLLAFPSGPQGPPGSSGLQVLKIEIFTTPPRQLSIENMSFKKYLMLDSCM